jgi:hypothetical protein
MVSGFVFALPMTNKNTPLLLSTRAGPATEAVHTLLSLPSWQSTISPDGGTFEPDYDHSRWGSLSSEVTALADTLIRQDPTISPGALSCSKISTYKTLESLFIAQSPVHSLVNI